MTLGEITPPGSDVYHTTHKEREEMLVYEKSVKR